jgi:hypothetical protein
MVGKILAGGYSDRLFGVALEAMSLGVVSGFRLSDEAVLGVAVKAASMADPSRYLAVSALGSLDWGRIPSLLRAAGGVEKESFVLHVMLDSLLVCPPPASVPSLHQDAFQSGFSRLAGKLMPHAAQVLPLLLDAISRNGASEPFREVLSRANVCLNISTAVDSMIELFVKAAPDQAAPFYVALLPILRQRGLHARAHEAVARLLSDRAVVAGAPKEATRVTMGSALASMPSRLGRGLLGIGDEAHLGHAEEHDPDHPSLDGTGAQAFKVALRGALRLADKFDDDKYEGPVYPDFCSKLEGSVRDCMYVALGHERGRPLVELVARQIKKGLGGGGRVAAGERAARDAMIAAAGLRINELDHEIGDKAQRTDLEVISNLAPVIHLFGSEICDSKVTPRLFSTCVEVARSVVVPVGEVSLFDDNPQALPPHLISAPRSVAVLLARCVRSQLSIEQAQQVLEYDNLISLYKIAFDADDTLAALSLLGLASDLYPEVLAKKSKSLGMWPVPRLERYVAAQVYSFAIKSLKSLVQIAPLHPLLLPLLCSCLDVASASIDDRATHWGEITKGQPHLEAAVLAVARDNFARDHGGGSQEGPTEFTALFQSFDYSAKSRAVDYFRLLANILLISHGKAKTSPPPHAQDLLEPIKALCTLKRDCSLCNYVSLRERSRRLGGQSKKK